MAARSSAEPSVWQANVRWPRASRPGRRTNRSSSMNRRSLRRAARGRRWPATGGPKSRAGQQGIGPAASSGPSRSVSPRGPTPRTPAEGRPGQPGDDLPNHRQQQSSWVYPSCSVVQFDGHFPVRRQLLATDAFGVEVILAQLGNLVPEIHPLRHSPRKERLDILRRHFPADLPGVLVELFHQRLKPAPVDLRDRRVRGPAKSRSARSAAPRDSTARRPSPRCGA